MDIHWFANQLNNSLPQLAHQPQSFADFFLYNTFLYDTTLATAASWLHGATTSLNGNGTQQ